MNMILFLLIAITIKFSLVSEFRCSVSSDDESDVENFVDLLVAYKHDNRTEIMRAYRSIRNVEILQRKEHQEFSQLTWFSIGYPILSHLSSKNSFPISNVFEITSFGFELGIDVLTNTQKELFIKKIKSKYGIDVTTEQIIELIPSELKCTTKVICSNGTNLILNGEANALSSFPLNVEFIELEKFECFEHHLIEHNWLKVGCVIKKNSKAIKTFSITWEQMSKSNLLDKLFGDSDEVYVTRQQMTELASEIHQSMNIYKQYEISKKEFSSHFIDGLIKQNVVDFKPVPIDTVLKSFSKYSTKNLNPNIIKINLSKVLEVKTLGDKKHITANSEYSECAGFSASASLNYVKEKERSWTNSGKKLDDQLKELNSYSRDNIEWELEGEKIVPKSLKVSRLVKTSFNEKLNFENIKRIVDVIFDINFSLKYTNDKLYERIENESIQISNNSIILDSVKTSSLINCIEACEENQICNYAQLSEEVCNLYEKIDYLIVESGNKQRLYERISKREPKIRKMSNWYKKLDKNISSSKECWEECLKELDCVYVNNDHSKFDCYLFYNDSFRVERINKSINYMSIYKKESSKSQKLDRYEKTQISGFFLSWNTQSEEACVNECRRRREICKAISFGENRCHLVKRGEYQLRRFNNWVSIYIESENPIKSQENSNYSYKKTLEGYDYFFWSLAVLHNGDLVGGSIHDTMIIWNSTDGSLKQAHNDNDHFVYSLVVLHNGNLVSSSYNKKIKIWNSKNFEVKRTITLNARVFSLAVFPNTDFASGSDDGSIIIWSSGGHYKRTLLGHTGSIMSLVVLPNGKLASASSDTTIKIWSHNGSLEKTLEGHSQSVCSLAILDNGLIASGPLDKTVKFWNENGELMHTQSYDSKITSLAVLPNGNLLIGFEDGTIRIKEKNKLGEQRKEKSLLIGHSKSVNSLVVFSNGDFASSSHDKKIIIWRQN